MSGQPRLSRRLAWEGPSNRLTQTLAARLERGAETIDLTVSNPMQVGLAYPQAELEAILGRGAAAPYAPHPQGQPTARQALAAALAGPGESIDPEDLVLTASTSEAYSYLFKLFGDAGDEVLTAAPTYPLLDSLTALDGLVLRHFPLEPGRRFRLDPGEVARSLSARTRVLVLVHPGNPTGSFVSTLEQDAVAALCRENGLPLVSDEVFADFRLAAPRRDVAGPAAARHDVLSFTLGGLSKSAGLPGWKLGWIRLGGPPTERRRAIAALQHIADSYLSVASPVQAALPEILELAPTLRALILERLRGNLALLRSLVASAPELDLIEPEGGWSAVLRVPRLQPDEDLAVALLESTGVLVHPGHFFDFASDGYLVLSLLPEPGQFAAGVGRLVESLRLPAR